MGAITTSLGGGLSDTANQTLTLDSGEDVLSEYTVNASSTYVSGGFDSLGNAYTLRPIGITDVTVRVGRNSSANVGITPIFKTNLSGKVPSRVNSTTILYTSSLPVSGDTSLSTESEYVYPLFTSDLGYYGFRGVSPSGVMEYGAGGNGFIESTYQLIPSTITTSDSISGSVTQASIPSAPLNVNASSITDTTANITWTGPVDDGIQSPASYSAANIKGYRINYRNSSLENWKVLVANTGSNALFRVVTELSPSTYYEVQVAALNAVTDAHNKKTFYTGNESPFDYSITAHVGSRSVTKTFTTAVSTHSIRVWTGTEFKKGIVKIWDGSAFLQYPNITAKVWDGIITTRTNLVVNPNFETNTTNWSVPYGSLSRVTTTPQTGTYCLQVDADGEGYLSASYLKSNSFSIGTSYRAGLWVRASGAATLQLTLSDSGSSTANTTFTATTSWQFVETPSITAAGTTAALGIDGQVNEIIFVDSAIIETTSTYTGTFFDGNTPDSGVIDYAWTGTANASTSTAIRSGFKELVLDS